MAYSFEEWRILTASSTSAQLGSALCDNIALVAFKAGHDGKRCGVWHAAAIVGNHLDRCNCSPCRTARGEEGPSPYRYRDLADRRVR